jgi:hypothetical protein
MRSSDRKGCPSVSPDSLSSLVLLWINKGVPPDGLTRWCACILYAVWASITSAPVIATRAAKETGSSDSAIPAAV